MPTSPPDAETIRQTLERVLASGEYDLQPRPEAEGSVSDFFDPLMEWLWEPVANLWEKLRGTAPWIDKVLAGIVILLLVALLVYLFRMRKKQPDLPLRSSESTGAQRPDELHNQARTSGEQGRFVEAVRLLLQASVLRLEQAEQRINRPGTTNRELLRRYRSSAVVRPLSTLVDTVDQSWFGDRPCTRLDYLDCLSAHDEIASASAPEISTAPIGGVRGVKKPPERDSPQSDPMHLLTPHFTTTRRVQFAETDMAGIVHFANFYRWMEETEHEFFRSCGLTIMSAQEDGRYIGWPRVSASCSFERPARYEDLLEIRLQIERIGVKSLTFLVEFYNGAQRIAHGRMKTACCLCGHDLPLESIAIPGDYLARLPQLEG